MVITVMRFLPYDAMLRGPCCRAVSARLFVTIVYCRPIEMTKHIFRPSSSHTSFCGILNKLKNRLPRHVLAIIYQSLILPYLQYCAIVWANCMGQL